MRLLQRWFRSRSGSSKPIENPELLKAIDEIARADNPKNRNRLYHAILGSTFVIPTPELPRKHDPNATTSGEGMRVQLVGFTNKNKQRVTPVFTDEAALRVWDPNTPWIGLNAKAYFQMIVGLEFDQVIINPFDPIRKMLRPGGIVTRYEFAALASGQIPILQVGWTDLGASTKIVFARPTTPLPSDIQTALKTAIERCEEIEAAYLVTLLLGEGKPTSNSALALKLRSQVTPALDAVFRELGTIVRPCLREGEPFDIMPLQAHTVADIEKTVAPFFKRGS